MRRTTGTPLLQPRGLSKGARANASSAFDVAKRNALRKLEGEVGPAGARDKSPKGSLDAPIAALVAFVNGLGDYVTTSSCSGRISVFASAAQTHQHGGAGAAHATHGEGSSAAAAAAKAVAEAAAATTAPSTRLSKAGPEHATATSALSSDKGSGSWLLASHACTDAATVMQVLREALAGATVTGAHRHTDGGAAGDPSVPRSGPCAGDAAASGSHSHQVLNVLLKHEPFILHVLCRGVVEGQRLLQVAIAAGFRESGLLAGRKTMVAVRTTSGLLEVPLVVDGRMLVDEAYVGALVNIANDRFRRNAARTERFFAALRDATKTWYGSATQDGSQRGGLTAPTPRPGPTSRIVCSDATRHSGGTLRAAGSVAGTDALEPAHAVAPRSDIHGHAEATGPAPRARPAVVFAAAAAPVAARTAESTPRRTDGRVGGVLMPVASVRAQCQVLTPSPCGIQRWGHSCTRTGPFVILFGGYGSPLSDVDATATAPAFAGAEAALPGSACQRLNDVVACCAAHAPGPLEPLGHDTAAVGHSSAAAAAPGRAHRWFSVPCETGAWRLYGTTSAAECVTPVPCARVRHAAAALTDLTGHENLDAPAPDPASHVEATASKGLVLVFGGRTSPGVALGDSWLLQVRVTAADAGRTPAASPTAPGIRAPANPCGCHGVPSASWVPLCNKANTAAHQSRAHGLRERHISHATTDDPSTDAGPALRARECASDPDSTPRARWGHTLVAVPARADAARPMPGRAGGSLAKVTPAERECCLLFGGRDSECTMGDLWMARVAMHLEPRARSRAVGDDGPHSSECARATVMGSVMWRRLRTAGDAPCARYSHASVFLPEHRTMVVHGGYRAVCAPPQRDEAASIVPCDDITVLHYDTLRWSQPRLVGVAGSSRAARLLARAAHTLTPLRLESASLAHPSTPRTLRFVALGGVCGCCDPEEPQPGLSLDNTCCVFDAQGDPSTGTTAITAHAGLQVALDGVRDDQPMLTLVKHCAFVTADAGTGAEFLHVVGGGAQLFPFGYHFSPASVLQFIASGPSDNCGAGPKGPAQGNTPAHADSSGEALPPVPADSEPPSPHLCAPAPMECRAGTADISRLTASAVGGGTTRAAPSAAATAADAADVVSRDRPPRSHVRAGAAGGASPSALLVRRSAVVKAIKVALELNGCYDKSRRIARVPAPDSLLANLGEQVPTHCDRDSPAQTSQAGNTSEEVLPHERWFALPITPGFATAVTELAEQCGAQGVGGATEWWRYRQAAELHSDARDADLARPTRGGAAGAGLRAVAAALCSPGSDVVSRRDGICLISSSLPRAKAAQRPMDAVAAALLTLGLERGMTAEQVRKDSPRKVEWVGDVACIPCDALVSPPWRDTHASALIESAPGVDPLRAHDAACAEVWSTLAKALGAHRLARAARVDPGLKRQSRARMLLGPAHGSNGGRPDPWVHVRENGLHYHFDIERVMFSSGNVTEKARQGAFAARGETVVDLFAGIGYFTIPLAHPSKGGAAVVHACDWNHDAIECLRRNVAANGVHDRVVIHEGDNALVAAPLRDMADRVLLGLIPSSESAWPTAASVMKPRGGWMHVHGNVADADVASWGRKVASAMERLGNEIGKHWRAECRHTERVKSYAPRVQHVVVDIRLVAREAVGAPAAVAPLTNFGSPTAPTTRSGPSVCLDTTATTGRAALASSDVGRPGRPRAIGRAGRGPSASTAIAHGASVSVGHRRGHQLDASTTSCLRGSEHARRGPPSISSSSLRATGGAGATVVPARVAVAPLRSQRADTSARSPPQTTRRRDAAPVAAVSFTALLCPHAR